MQNKVAQEFTVLLLVLLNLKEIVELVEEFLPKLKKNNNIVKPLQYMEERF